MGWGGVCKVMITLRDVLCFRCELVTWVDHISHCQVLFKSLSLFSVQQTMLGQKLYDVTLASISE